MTKISEDFEFYTKTTEIDGRRNEVEHEIKHYILIETNPHGRVGTVEWDRERDDGITWDREFFDFRVGPEEGVITFAPDHDLSEFFAYAEVREKFERLGLRVAPHWSLAFTEGMP